MLLIILFRRKGLWPLEAPRPNQLWGIGRTPARGFNSPTKDWTCSCPPPGSSCSILLLNIIQARTRIRRPTPNTAWNQAHQRPSNKNRGNKMMVGFLGRLLKECCRGKAQPRFMETLEKILQLGIAKISLPCFRHARASRTQFLSISISHFLPFNCLPSNKPIKRTSLPSIISFLTSLAQTGRRKIAPPRKNL